jgi:hypothetical protein
VAVQALDKNPLYVVAFLAILAAPQARGFALQFATGFRPFQQAPERVPFSWDMFSIPITRCTIDWVPKVTLGRAKVGHLHERGMRIEWDPVYDRAEDYAGAANYECANAPRTTTVIQCFHENGHTTRDELHCR